MAVYADSIQAKVNGTAQAVPLRDSDAQQQLATKAPGIIETASGESIQIADSSDLPLTGLRIYGKGVQSGTASPENPVPINIPGEDGNIEVNFTGTNLLNYNGEMLPNIDVIYTFQLYVGDGNFTLSSNVPKLYSGNAAYLFIGPGKLNASQAGSTDTTGVWDGQSRTVNSKDGYITVFARKDAELNPFAGYEIMLNRGNSNLPYVPYENQEFIIQTPNGLPGIPVDSGGNYTDASGQKWVSDIYDAIAGEYHHYTATIESYNGETITTPYISTTGSLTTGAKVIYALETPTVESVESFTANSYYPNTNIFTDDTVQPGIEVDYVADTKLYIDNKVSAAVTQAVAISQA